MEAPLRTSSHPRDSSMRRSITLRIRVMRTHSLPLPSLSHFRRRPARSPAFIYTIPSPATAFFSSLSLNRTENGQIRYATLVILGLIALPYDQRSLKTSRTLPHHRHFTLSGSPPLTFRLRFHLIVRPSYTRGPLAPHILKHTFPSLRKVLSLSDSLLELYASLIPQVTTQNCSMARWKVTISYLKDVSRHPTSCHGSRTRHSP